MTAEELLERYAAGERDFSGVDLSDEDLSLAQLPEIILRDCILDQTVFDSCDLSYGNLSGSYLFQSSFDGTKLRKANLIGANLAESSFRNAILDDANLSCTNLSGTILRNASTSKTSFDGALFCRTGMPDESWCNDGCSFSEEWKRGGFRIGE
jgi:uncharacterized protein YjbI with pentapeptide repeats